MTPFRAFAQAPITATASPAEPGVVLDTAMTDDWLQGRVAFGGIQGALAALAMRAAVGPELPMRALQFTFVSAIQAGPVQAEASVLRQGRAITHAQCRLISAGRVAALAVGLYGAGRETLAEHDMPAPAGVKPIETLHDAPWLPDRMPGFLKHWQMRWAGGALPFSGQPARPATVWARLREQPLDAEAPAWPTDAAGREACRVALADLPASPVLSRLTRPAPGASLTWLLEWLADPREGDPADWTLLQTETRHAAQGYTSQTARLWTAQGRPLGVSHQTTAVFG
jgi:acyl-CoA thioesterase